MAKIDAITIMIQHRQMVLDTYAETGRNTLKTYEVLKDRLPELQISLSQFKPYIRAMALTAENMADESERIRQNNAELTAEVNRFQAEIHALRTEMETAESEIERLRKELSRRPAPDREKDPAKSIDGWNIVLSGGYYRLFRKVNGKMEAIYIGKKLDKDSARAKIREKEKALGIDV